VCGAFCSLSKIEIEIKESKQNNRTETLFALFLNMRSVSWKKEGTQSNAMK
jgi:hypothetical protein